jgi:hypothetical protein
MPCTEQQAITRTREEQRAWIIRTAAIGAAAGLLAFPLLVFPIARMVSFGNLPDGLAASALGEDRWNAGMELMSRAMANSKPASMPRRRPEKNSGVDHNQACPSSLKGRHRHSIPCIS